jgi:Family of unknown function (DUF6294)
MSVPYEISFVESGDHKTATWAEGSNWSVGDCSMQDGVTSITLNKDGTAKWKSRIESSDTNDTWNVQLDFWGSDDIKLFDLRFHKKMDQDHTWYDWEENLRFARGLYDAVVGVTRQGNC